MSQNEHTKLSRRSALAGISMFATTAVPAASARAAGTDPIFAVIREHAAAMRAQSAHYDHIAELERSIPADRRTWSWSAAMQTPPVGCTHAPDHIAAQLAIGTAFDRRSDAFVALLTTAPRTLAGVAALLDHLGSDEYPDDAGRRQGNHPIRARLGAPIGAAVLPSPRSRRTWQVPFAP